LLSNSGWDLQLTGKNRSFTDFCFYGKKLHYIFAATNISLILNDYLMTTHNQNRTVGFAVLIIVAGVILLLNSLNLFPHDLSRIIVSWQMLLIGIGVVSLINSKEKVSGIILIAIGGIFLLAKISDLPVSVWSIFWPTLLIIIGVSLLYGHRNRMSKPLHSVDELSSGEKSDYLDEIAIFGGNEKQITSKNFRGGRITNIFGGSELNFTGAQLADGEHIIDVLYIFGGSSLVVPNDWDVQLDVVSIFGGFSDKRFKKLDPDAKKRITIKGLVIFGGGDIKSY